MLEKIKNKKIVSRARDWYGKYERPVSSLSLIGGFVFDALVLKNVGAFWDNFWVLAHIVIIAVLLIIIHVVENNPGDEADPDKLHFWLVNALQFVFGGLLSVFLVFYFRSSDISVSWPFLSLLALAFWANESLKRRFVRLTFQISLFFLSLFLCSIFLVPVIVHQIGDKIFLLSGLVSLLAIALFLLILKYSNRKKFEQSKDMVLAAIAIIFIGMNLLYFTNIIPPIPLSLKDFEMFQSITKNSDGNYIVTYEDAGFRTFFRLHEDIHTIPDETVYAYTAVFSPTDLNTTIIHQWQYYNVATHSWIDDGETELALVGGRNAGFRTYSSRSGLLPGQWRVNALTQSGQVLGQLRFTVSVSSTTPALSTKILD